MKPEEKKGTTLIEKENVETGSVKMDVYFYYMKVTSKNVSLLSYVLMHLMDVNNQLQEMIN